ncbi:MAG: hypothetical protein IPM91_10635 [Bacteroidetes bacterium]|nr:hypothetical protein [Bacteroidota bacterium]
METLFPDDKREEQHLYKAFELIETERVIDLLRKMVFIVKGKSFSMTSESSMSSGGWPLLFY